MTAHSIAGGTGKTTGALAEYMNRQRLGAAIRNSTPDWLRAYIEGL
jgi:hypothetical protein